MGAVNGLKDVVAAESSISRIAIEDGKAVLEYRGYNIHDLARHSTYEEVAYLLLFGELPSKSDLEYFSEDLKERRELPPQIVGLLTNLSPFCHPMVALRTAVSFLGTMDKHISFTGHEKSIEKAKNLIAKFPTIVAYFHRIRMGEKLVHPSEDLGHAANFLYMLHGEEPTKTMEKALDLDFILHADHELNASTFAARVAASTLADMYACVVAATGTLIGPLHGGAAQRVMEMLREVALPKRAERYVLEKLAKGERIMGFGHRVYRNVIDPRTVELKRLARMLSKEKGTRWFEISEAIEKAVYRHKGLLPNVDFYSASVYANLGIPDDLFINIFAIGRVSGWTAHIIEQYENNVLIRPRAEYIGPAGKKFLPLSERE
ncbi:citrate/2-methylcitrate synthase [Geoglobus acetivorans]|uniref:Citrate synthase n=1 Tax=Geoglobus acetivorans TaxID=565033 RepID=A0ABZ3GZY5_GEOAI|nr:citrate synthase [Geoglobus acetivorans]